MNTQIGAVEQGVPVPRRAFIKALLTFSVVATVSGMLTPIVAYVWPQRKQAAYGGPTDVGATEDFPPGSGTIVSVDNKPVVLVNTKAGGLKAFSAICTHLGCIVYWHQQKNVLHSPCHDGLFSPTTGAVVSGPPPRPLPAYELSIRDGRVLIGKPLGEIYKG